MLAAYLKKIGQRAGRLHAFGQGSGLQQLSHRIRRVAVVADQGLQRAATPTRIGVLAAQFVGVRAKGIFLCAARLQGFTQRGDLAFQALQGLGRRFKAQLGLPALYSQALEFITRLIAFGLQAFGLAFQSGQALFCLCGAVAGIACQREQVHRVAAIALEIAAPR